MSEGIYLCVCPECVILPVEDKYINHEANIYFKNQDNSWSRYLIAVAI